MMDLIVTILFIIESPLKIFASAKLYEYETDEYSNDEDTDQYTYADGEYDTGTDTDDATASTQMAVYNVHSADTGQDNLQDDAGQATVGLPCTPFHIAKVELPFTAPTPYHLQAHEHVHDCDDFERAEYNGRNDDLELNDGPDSIASSTDATSSGSASSAGPSVSSAGISSSARWTA
jgi:hypothetical protein